jgi:arylsulfatase
MTARPPIHLLFAGDRGLRDGDWKLVSFRSQPWELYNIANDRAELHNVAAAHPEMVERMAKQWHDMAGTVLMVPPNERRPVAGTATGHVHREWSNYEGKHGASTSSRAGKAKAGTRKSDGKPIRARRETKLVIKDGELLLTCEDGDPGLVFDHFGPVAEAGPYTLAFEIRSEAGGEAEAYFTTDAQTTPPKGERVEFEVVHDGKWHTVTLELQTEKTLHALRLDPCSTVGEVRIKGLVLKTKGGTVVKEWP